jgi:hypothetical protein
VPAAGSISIAKPMQAAAKANLVGDGMTGAQSS